MQRTDRTRDEVLALKPIGKTLAAVVAGLGVAGQAQPVEKPVAPPLEPTTNVRAHYVDPTNDPRLDEDPTLILGPSEPVEPFAEQSAPVQKDLFDL
ncbi:MAG TPA: hypothetical protein VG943_16900 [Caulobacterales bacterium]|nr:hypothetical protein [Caulobacterales bacterium]